MSAFVIENQKTDILILRKILVPGQILKIIPNDIDKTKFDYVYISALVCCYCLLLGYNIFAIWYLILIQRFILFFLESLNFLLLFSFLMSCLICSRRHQISWNKLLINIHQIDILQSQDKLKAKQLQFKNRILIPQLLMSISQFVLGYFLTTLYFRWTCYSIMAYQKYYIIMIMTLVINLLLKRSVYCKIYLKEMIFCINDNMETDIYAKIRRLKKMLYLITENVRFFNIIFGYQLLFIIIQRLTSILHIFNFSWQFFLQPDISPIIVALCLSYFLILPVSRPLLFSEINYHF